MTEHAKKLLLLYYKQSRKIRRVSGLPPLIFKAKKAGTLNNYRIYGNTETKTRSYSGSAPLSFPIVDGAVSNYRVYGNTVGGESVGDRTGNLFDSNINVISGYLSDDGILKPANETSQITFDYIPIISGTYTLTYTVPTVYELWFGVCTYDESRTFQSRLVSEYSGAATFTIPDTTKYIRISLRGYNETPIIMLNEGSTALPYEPYGYKMPVTVSNGTDAQTIPIYLPEQIRKVGDEAEYIDYGEQKQHRVRKNLANNKHTGTPVNYTITENDNYIHAVGTNTTSNTQAIILSNFVDLEAGEYDLVNNSSVIINVDYYDENGIAQYFNVPSNSIKTFTYPSNVTRALNVYKAISAGNSIDAYFQVMIVKHGNDTTIYEPYIENTEVDITLPALPTLPGTNSLSVGTVVQPSSVAVDVNEVVSCGDRTTENLFDGTFIHRSVIETTVCNDNPNRRSIVVDISSFNNGDKITFSRETSAGNVFQMYQVTSPLEGGRLFNSNVISGDSNTLLATITLDNISNYHYLMIFLNGAANTITDEELLASKIMVNVGNTPLPYEPYGYKVPVTVEGKNLFDGEIEQGGYDGSGLNIDNTLRVRSTNYIPVVGGETYNLHALSKSSLIIHVSYYTKNDYTTRRFGCIDWTQNTVFTTPSNCKYIRFLFKTLQDSVITPDDISNIMLNAGSTPLPYEPYHTPVTTTIYLPEPIKMVGDEAEYIDYGEQKQHRVRKNYFQSSDFEAGAIYTGQGWGNITYQDSKTPSGMQDTGQVAFYKTRKRSTDLITISGTYTISIADGWEFGIVMFSDGLNSGELFTYNTTPVTISNCTFAIQFRKTDVSDISSADISDYKIMLNKGSTPLPYEPYIENTDLDVTLPVLPTLPGINEVSVGTEVQPSGVEIKGRIKAAGGD